MNRAAPHAIVAARPSKGGAWRRTQPLAEPGRTTLETVGDEVDRPRFALSYVDRCSTQ